MPELMEKGGRTYRLIKDQLGSVRLVVDVEDGSIVQEMRYDAWGNVVFDSNPGFQPFGFAGGLYDPQTRLVRFGARDYDASIGMWLSKDPLLFADLRTGGVGSPYAYAAASPVWWIDPSGLWTWANLPTPCDQLRKPIQDACARLKNPECRKALQRCGALECMDKACKKGTGCPKVDCTDDGKRWSRHCGEQSGCEVWINLRKAPFGSGCPPFEETIFHEFLHFCGIHHEDENDPYSYGGCEADAVRACKGGP